MIPGGYHRKGKQKVGPEFAFHFSKTAQTMEENLLHMEE
jgi:hypothetical protein